VSLLALAFGGFTSDKANAKLGEVILSGNRFAYRLNLSRFFFSLAHQILASLFLSWLSSKDLCRLLRDQLLE
jgi:hypothetical protein